MEGIMLTEQLATEAAEIRTAVLDLEPIGRRRRYSQELQERILKYLESGSSAGQRREELATAAGVPAKTVDRWLRRRRTESGAGQAKMLAAVRVSSAGMGGKASSPVVLISRNGVRLEGIDLASAISVLRALG
jgi:hypothetical protein